MPSKPASRFISDYNKEELVKALKDVKSRIEETILGFDDQVAKWKKEAPGKFASDVENWRPGDFFRGHTDPPKLSSMCADYRIQNLNQAIARIGLMDGDVVKLHREDPIWQFIGLGECL